MATIRHTVRKALRDSTLGRHDARIAELWSATEPKPITDDFLRLLNESFGSTWRNPLKWPWSRLLWAYGFPLVGVVLTAGAGIIVWSLILIRP